MLSLVLSAIVPFVWVIYFAAPTILFGQSTDSQIQWRVGKALDRYTNASFSGLMSKAPIGTRLKKFATSQRVGLFIDRRVDPSLKLSISIQNGTIEQFFWGIADSLDLGVCKIDDLYYMADKDVSAALPIAWSNLKKADSEQRSKSDVAWTARDSLSSSSVVSPKSLLLALSDRHGFSIDNPDEVPHDLWAGFETPPLTLEGRVAILLAGFGKWYERSSDGKSIKIIDFPNIKKGQIRIVEVSDSQALAKRMRARFSELKISASGKSLTGTGPVAELARFKAAVVKAKRPNTGTESAKTFTLNTTASRGSILASLAKQTDRKFVYAKPAPKALTEQIKISVKEFTVEQIIAEVVRGTSLEIDYSDNELSVK